MGLRPRIVLVTAFFAASALVAQTGCERNRPVARPGSGETVFDFFTPPTPAQAAAWASDPYDADKRLRGLLLLANAPWGGEPAYVRMYALAARDGDPGVRAVALRALAMHGTVEHAALMIESLSDANELVRWESARALQRVHSPDAVSPLLDRLSTDREESTQVRAAAARALGQYAQPRVVEGLIGALGDRSLTVNKNALESLRVLTGENFAYDGRAWLRWTRATPDVFAGRQPYVFPVFERDQRFIEYFMPWFAPPNEIAASPIGMPPDEAAGRVEQPDRSGG